MPIIHNSLKFYYRLIWIFCLRYLYLFISDIVVMYCDKCALRYRTQVWFTSDIIGNLYKITVCCASKRSWLSWVKSREAPNGWSPSCVRFNYRIVITSIPRVTPATPRQNALPDRKASILSDRVGSRASWDACAPFGPCCRRLLLMKKSRDFQVSYVSFLLAFFTCYFFLLFLN